MFPPSKYQSAVYDWHDQHIISGGSLVVQSVAGSGKTTTGVASLRYHVPESVNSIAVAFNRDIADNLVPKLPGRTVKTYHALGLMNITNTFGKVKIEQRKIDVIMRDRLAYWERSLLSPISKLVGLCKNNLLEPTETNLTQLAENYDVDLNGDMFKVFEYAQTAYNESLKMTSIIDFDDMISMPTLLNLATRQFDYMFVDELQDTNAAQADLVFRSISKGGVIVGYGDVRQSIYAFRGADVQAMNKFSARFSADQLPLSITYRNPLEVVKLVNENFPDITFEAYENAIIGEVNTVNRGTETYLPDDMILCRTNAPLVEPCFELIRKGIKATIRGRDIGKNLISMIDKFKVPDLRELLYRISIYRDSEMNKLLVAEKTVKAQLLDDKVETIIALSDGCITIDDLRNRINTVFSDDQAAVTFSTIHKAKGLEAKRVYILHPELLPHPMAVSDWARQQEDNLKYVAYTRALESLTFIV